MNTNRIKQLLKQGEGISVEFKTCHTELNKNVYETVCAFLNRVGGELLMGVKDNGEIQGIHTNYVENIKKEFVTTINNPQKINPTSYLNIESIETEGKLLLYVLVPQSSQVHRCNNKIYDRSENTVYPYAEMADLRPDIIARARKMASSQREDHPWGNMNDLEILKSAQLYAKDLQTRKEGFTLAGILLFGKYSTILSVLPHFKTDALLRRDNIDRYDDRDDIRTNLIDSYDRLVNFGTKHLNDPFYLEGDQRISLRSHILREVVSNLLIHREFTNAFPARFVIEKEQFYTENSNRPHGYGAINPKQFYPHPKNPTIARVFKEIGRADELGSGVRKLFKYCKSFCGHDPQLIEKDIFRFILSLTLQVKPSRL